MECKLYIQEPQSNPQYHIVSQFCLNTTFMDHPMLPSYLEENKGRK